MIVYFFYLGYTFHQGSFLYVTASGDVVLDSVATATSISQGQRRISRSKRSLNMPIPPTRQRQGTLEAIKDIISKYKLIFSK